MLDALEHAAREVTGCPVSVIRLLQRAGLLNEDRTRLLLSWPHSGFSVHNFVTVPAGDDLDLYRLRCGEMPQPDEQQGTAIEPQGGMTASPGYVPAAGGEFDSGVLSRIEESLASAVGPLAKVLVRKTARTAPTLEALCGTLAEQIAETAGRDKFLAKHVGPLARVLVKKAAKGEGNMSHVITKLEFEIDSDDARRAFRAAVKRLR